ncbi:hypothetical protein VP1G_06406 [Cytospora mali]|uniref:Nephrocystin 3-like N-terminal domain-containing protein n=1 Tax=Cytospora mali TaxID=578113 RepID=A0A194V5A8_CYTMA|nr:hypothetical protein VP1G_06406 [Valsa mali var. pyri (nom. inval.)]
MKVIPAHDLVLDILWFEAITTRQRSVDPAHNATFRWLLSETDSYQSGTENDTGGSDWDPDDSGYSNSEFGDDTERSESELVSKRLWTQRKLEQKYLEAMKRRHNRQAFLSWLRVGNGVFYISGKAGAGKSTLMKYLTQEEKTLRELHAWAGSDGKQLILTRFFFWNSGDQLQRSLEGMYRSILWDILRQFPNLIPHVFPDIWSAAISTKHKNTRHHPSFHVELKDLYAALDRIFTSQKIGNQHKLCIFIDGVDEFDGDYWSLSKAISSWSAAAHIKFCISSRPYNEFERIFASDPSRHFRLHEMTRQDMFRFVRSEFRDDERSAAIRADTYHYYSLLEEIVERSDGIFLWIHLVTYEMLKAMGNQYSLAQLHQRLNDIPKGLYGLFQANG